VIASFLDFLFFFLPSSLSDESESLSELPELPELEPLDEPEPDPLDESESSDLASNCLRSLSIEPLMVANASVGRVYFHGFFTNFLINFLVKVFGSFLEETESSSEPPVDLPDVLSQVLMILNTILSDNSFFFLIAFTISLTTVANLNISSLLYKKLSGMNIGSLLYKNFSGVNIGSLFYRKHSGVNICSLFYKKYSGVNI